MILYTSISNIAVDQMSRFSPILADGNIAVDDKVAHLSIHLRRYDTVAEREVENTERGISQNISYIRLLVKREGGNRRGS